MNTLHLVCILLLILLFPSTLFASSVKMFFTDEDLTEMGIRIEPSDLEREGVAA